MKAISIVFVATLLAAWPLRAAEPGSPGPACPLWDGKETILAYAQRTKLSEKLVFVLGGTVQWEGMLIPPGTFVMGSPLSETKNEKVAEFERQHKVTISQPFYMGKYEITQAQYRLVMGANPSRTMGDNLPVHGVSWQEAQEFCRKASKLMNMQVDLPTEAQWEYACRAGTTTAYHSGNDIADLRRVAWIGSNSGGKIHPVGEKPANAWGLHDMHGNAREFVRDLYGDFPKGDAIDPTGPKEGDSKNHVVRGGAFTANAETALNCRSATRKPTESLAMNGFRIVIAVAKPK